jgi:hypothetical protein
LQTIKPIGFGGANYYLVAVNGATCWTVVFMLKKKSDAAAKLIELFKWLKTHTRQYYWE